MSKYVDYHFCNIPAIDSGIPKLPPNPHAWQRVKTCIRRITTVSSRNKQTFLYIPSHSELRKERKRHFEHYWYIIHPLSSFTKYWQIIMCISWAIMIPFEAAVPAFWTNRINKQKLRKLSFVTLYHFTHYTSMLDVLLNFFTGYTIFDTKEIILEPWRIAGRYLKTFFFTDILVFIMIFYWYYNLIGKNPNELFMCILLTIKTLRLIRFISVLRILKNICSYLDLKSETYMKISMLLSCFFLIHLSACLLVYVPNLMRRVNGNLSPKSWISKLENSYRNRTKRFDNSILYAHGVMEALYKFNCVSVGQVTPETMEDIWVTTIIMLVGCCYNMYFMLFLFEMMNVAYKSAVQYDTKKSEIVHYARNKKLRMDLEQSLLHNFELIYEKEYFKRDFNQYLSTPLKIKLFWECSKGLTSAKVFKGVPNLEPLIKCLKVKFFLPGAIIAEMGTANPWMYFLASGTAAVMTPDDVELCHLRDGDYFGLAGVTRDVPPIRKTDVIAIELCEVYVLEKEDFDIHVPPDSLVFGRLMSVERRMTLQVADDYENGML